MPKYCQTLKVQVPSHQSNWSTSIQSASGRAMLFDPWRVLVALSRWPTLRRRCGCSPVLRLQLWLRIWTEPWRGKLRRNEEEMKGNQEARE
ncbi:hypothetical protein N657DRAFT_694660 [Parathielavia appendiculata]|uniref:Uncharacterized protein n=1 Tax=Parathielavia appendiculata TaxID=2587402 RepID=A0AAN6TP69_9PEZI|nr:hypothetical protein N657DRAFT_694660 [Parathielavia appendiculata]